jgi:chromosome segregation ATPase
MEKATALRGKEAAAYAKESSDYSTNIAALAKATAAIEKGVTGFLQTTEASVVRTLAIEKATLPDASREELLAFLSGTQVEGYVPQSGEIIGILKTMHDEMSASLADATAAEEAAIQTYEALMKAKKEEVAALSAQIETEIKRIGDLGAEIAGMANDLEDTKEALAEDTKFLAELNKGCDTKAAEYEEIKKTRAEELVALSETIKVLNDDDALELFKKTLPSASASFVQMYGNVASIRSRAVSILRKPARTELDLIALALNGKATGFEKVTKMIDEMVANLKNEQGEDDDKKAYCNAEFDKTDDQKKGLEQNIADSEAAIEELQGAIAALRDEMASLEAGIKALDKSVAEATEQRKEEHTDYTTLMANDGAAKEVLAWAKNRLNKFYNPKLYVAPPKRELSEEDRITVNMGGTLAPTQPPGGIAGTGISAAQVAPAPPPSIGTYGKKSEEGNGVIAMIDLLVKDLDKEMTESEVNEKDAQADYEKLMAASAEKRAQDSKSISDKAASKASAEEALQAEQDSKAGASKQLALTLEAIHALHGECDWLLKYFDARKEARAGEVNALENAKAVLAGADYSLVQVSRHGFLK